MLASASRSQFANVTLVYVIGLHAVQFGSQRNFSNPIISKLDRQHVVLSRVNYNVHEVCLVVQINS